MKIKSIKLYSLFKLFSGSSINIIGSVLQNFILIFFASKINDSNFLFYNTVQLTILSTFYSIENAFQYHFGRILNGLSIPENNNEYIVKYKKLGLIIKDSVELVLIQKKIILFIYKSLFLINIFISILIFLFFDNYIIIIFIYTLISSFQIIIGYNSIQLIALNKITKYHHIIGFSKLIFVIIGIMIYYLKINTYIFYFSFLLSVILQLVLIRKNFDENKNSSIIQSIKININILKIHTLPAVKQSTIILVSFILFKSYLLFGSNFVSKNLLSSISLTQNLFSLTLMFGGMYTVLNMNKFYTASKKVKFKIFKISISFSLIIFFLGSITIFIINTYVFKYLNFTKISFDIFLLIMLIYFFETILGITATLFLYLQKVIYFNSSIVTALMIILYYISLYCFFPNTANIYYLLVGPLILQLFFNYWYYPYKMYKYLNK